MHIGTAVIGNKVAVRRVAKFTKDDEGNKVPLKGAGNINEAFTVPFLKKGKTPPKVRKQAQVKLI
ncbi:hypothetical protein D8T33_14385 [Vibrio vulnificus]|nr:hypothetical protein D8T33_14385 [Vibrio vulnificus]